MKNNIFEILTQKPLPRKNHYLGPYLVILARCVAPSTARCVFAMRYTHKTRKTSSATIVTRWTPAGIVLDATISIFAPLAIRASNTSIRWNATRCYRPPIRAHRPAIRRSVRFRRWSNRWSTRWRVANRIAGGWVWFFYLNMQILSKNGNFLGKNTKFYRKIENFWAKNANFAQTMEFFGKNYIENYENVANLAFYA